jgi:hypothetical protein
MAFASVLRDDIGCSQNRFTQNNFLINNDYFLATHDLMTAPANNSGSPLHTR